MPQVLLTGANGFIGTHILASLLEHGYDVTAVVRSEQKAESVKKTHGSNRLHFAVVPDISKENAFQGVLAREPPFGAVIHCASPFTFAVKDIDAELLRPAIGGTVNLLRTIRATSPKTKRFIMTSSLAAIENPFKGPWPEHEYSEKDWSPLTRENALEHPVFGYLGSKALSERAAWDFINGEENGGQIKMTALNPPLIFGPVIQPLDGTNEVNTSNTFIRDLARGDCKTKLPDTIPPYWIDARDVALAHVKALESTEAEGQRIIIMNGLYSNQEISSIVRDKFPHYADRLPPKDIQSGGLPPGGVARVDTSNAQRILKIKFRSLDECVADVVRSLEAAGQLSSKL